MKQLKRQLLKLLEDHRIYLFEEDIHEDLELVGKAYGDSYEIFTQTLFGEDYKKLDNLCKQLNIETPEIVWFD